VHRALDLGEAVEAAVGARLDADHLIEHGEARQSDQREEDEAHEDLD
jgi:hypothetical protein